MATGLISQVLLVVNSIGRAITMSLRVGWRLLSLVLGLMLIFVGMILGMTFIGSICGLPMVVVGLMLMVRGLI